MLQKARARKSSVYASGRPSRHDDSRQFPHLSPWVAVVIGLVFFQRLLLPSASAISTWKSVS